VDELDGPNSQLVCGVHTTLALPQDVDNENDVRRAEADRERIGLDRIRPRPFPDC
jgi:hypothetical protein